MHLGFNFKLAGAWKFRIYTTWIKVYTFNCVSHICAPICALIFQRTQCFFFSLFWSLKLLYLVKPMLEEIFCVFMILSPKELEHTATGYSTAQNAVLALAVLLFLLTCHIIFYKHSFLNTVRITTINHLFALISHNRTHQ